MIEFTGTCKGIDVEASISETKRVCVTLDVPGPGFDARVYVSLPFDARIPRIGERITITIEGDEHD